MREIRFNAWDQVNKVMLYDVSTGTIEIWCSKTKKKAQAKNCIFLQYTGLKDKNGKEVCEGDVVGKEEVYHFFQRNGWQPEAGHWKIIGEKTKNFIGNKEEKYIAGYELSVVEWRDESCGFEPFSDSKKNCGHCGGGKDPIETEIIGNIHENPELLK